MNAEALFGTIRLIGQIGMWEMFAILAMVLVILFGAELFPDLGRGFREGMQEFERARVGVERTWRWTRSETAALVLLVVLLTVILTVG